MTSPDQFNGTPPPPDVIGTNTPVITQALEVVEKRLGYLENATKRVEQFAETPYEPAEKKSGDHPETIMSQLELQTGGLLGREQSRLIIESKEKKTDTKRTENT